MNTLFFWCTDSDKFSFASEVMLGSKYEYLWLYEFSYTKDAAMSVRCLKD